LPVNLECEEYFLIKMTNLWIWPEVEIKQTSGTSCHLRKVIQYLKNKWNFV